MDKSRTSRSLVVKRFAGFSLYNWPNDVTIMTYPNTKRKSFGRPIKAKHRVGTESLWVRHRKSANKKVKK